MSANWRHAHHDHCPSRGRINPATEPRRTFSTQSTLRGPSECPLAGSCRRQPVTSALRDRDQDRLRPRLCKKTRLGKYCRQQSTRAGLLNAVERIDWGEIGRSRIDHCASSGRIGVFTQFRPSSDALIPMLLEFTKLKFLIMEEGSVDIHEPNHRRRVIYRLTDASSTLAFVRRMHGLPEGPPPRPHRTN
jgi:hypothetical protein